MPFVFMSLHTLVQILEYSPQRSFPTHNYSLRINACCCGRVNNCCGASCFRDNVIIDIVDENDNVVSTIQMPYAPSDGCEACCRFIQHYKYEYYIYTIYDIVLIYSTSMHVYV